MIPRDSYHCHSIVVSSLIDVELNPSKFKTVLSAFLCWNQVYVSPAFSTLKWSELAAYGYFVEFVPGRPHHAKQASRAVPWQADDRAGSPRPGKHVFLTYKNPFSFAVF